jgi:hypothetical protein
VLDSMGFEVPLELQAAYRTPSAELLYDPAFDTMPLAERRCVVYRSSFAQTIKYRRIARDGPSP